MAEDILKTEEVDRLVCGLRDAKPVLKPKLVGVSAQVLEALPVG